MSDRRANAQGNPFKAWLIAPGGAPGRDRDIEAIDRVLCDYERIERDGFVTAVAIRRAFVDDLGIYDYKGLRLVWVIGEAVRDVDHAWCLKAYGPSSFRLDDLWDLLREASRRWPHDRLVVVFDVCHAGVNALPEGVAAFMACRPDEKTLARDETGGWLTQRVVECLEQGTNTPHGLAAALNAARPGTQWPVVHLGAHPLMPINAHWPASRVQLDGAAHRDRQAARDALIAKLRAIIDRESAAWLRDHFTRFHQPGDVVDQLCNLPGEQVAPWLLGLATDHPTQTGAVREVACLIMPILTDWDRLQALLTRQLLGKDRLLRLPVVDLSVCEMIMAGLGGRSAAFIRSQQTCVGILAHASQARIHRPALFSAPLLPTREAKLMPALVAQAIVDASGRARRGDVFRQARGILIATRLMYQSYLVVDDACAQAAIDAVLDAPDLPGLMVAQAYEDPAYEVLSSALETVLELLFATDPPQD